MTLPIDCIVAVYYSGAVNVASTNSQSLSSQIVQTQQLVQQGRQIKGLDKRLLTQHLINLFGFPAFIETLFIQDLLSAHRLIVRPLAESTITISSTLKRKSIVALSNLMTLVSGIVNIGGHVGGFTGYGDGSYVQLNSTASFSSQISISVWAKYIRGDFGYGGIIAFVNGYVGNRLLLSDDGQTVLFELNVGSVDLDCSFVMTSPGFVGTWHHFAATYDGANIQLYVDGVLGTTVPATGVIRSGSSKPQIGFGSSNVYHLNGNIAETALYNQALTASDIANIYNNGTNTVSTGLVSYYKMNEGSGTVIHDSGPAAIDGTLINEPTWDTDLHTPIPNPSIYAGFHSEVLTKLTKYFRSISQTFNIINEALSRKLAPFIAAQTITISDLLNNAIRIITLIENFFISEGSGFTDGFSDPFLRIPAITTKFIPYIAETITITSSILRLIPKSLAQSITISSALTGFKGKIIAIAQTITITESKLRRAIPRIATQTTTITDAQLRKVFPKIPTEIITLTALQLRLAIPKIAAEATITITDSLLRAPIQILTDTITITESQLRRVKPAIATQTTTITELLGHVGKHIRASADTITITETKLRKAIPKITSATITISGTVVGLKGRLIAIIEPLVIIFENLGKVAKHVRTDAEPTTTISESLRRKPIPKITSATITISESIKRLIPRSFADTITISGVLIRKIPKVFAEATITISGVSVVIGKHIRALPETITISEIRLRRIIPKIATQSITITESQIRKVIPKIVSPLISITGTIGKLSQQTILDTITITETRLRRVKPKIAVQTTTINDTLVRKIARPIAQSISIVELALRHLIRRIMETETTITISDSLGNTNVVSSIKTVIYNIQSGLVPSTFPSGQGFAGEGETKNRPIPVRDYIRDYTMRYRKRWGGNW